MQINCSYYGQRAIEAMNIKVQGLENQMRNLQSKSRDEIKLLQPVIIKIIDGICMPFVKSVWKENGVEIESNFVGTVIGFDNSDPLTNFSDVPLSSGYEFDTKGDFTGLVGSTFYYIITSLNGVDKTIYEVDSINKNLTKTTEDKQIREIFGDGFKIDSIYIDGTVKTYSQGSLSIQYYPIKTQYNTLLYHVSGDSNIPIYVTNKVVQGIHQISATNTEIVQCLALSEPIGKAQFGRMFEKKFAPR